MPFAGEASALPGWSVDTTKDVLDESLLLPSLLPPLATSSFPLSRTWRTALAELHSPALRMGVESLILDHLSVTAPELFLSTQQQVLAVNALVVPHAKNELFCQTLKKVHEGYTSIKIKLRPETLPNSITELRSLCGEIHPQASLRLDPNRSLTQSQCEQLIAACDGLPVEYIEDPLRNSTELESLVAQSPVSIALDESARQFPEDEWLSWKGVKHIVIKPTLSGSLLSLDDLISRTAEKNISITLSSSFESGIGLRAIALCAALFQLPAAVGLDTARFITTDFLAPRFPCNVPKINIPELLMSRPCITLAENEAQNTK
jgi:O-succinylbenzoate synthase